MNGSRSSTLTLDRLDLIAAAVEHLEAELEAPERLASLLNARVDPGWPPGEYDRGAQEFFRDRLKEGGAEVLHWYGWYALLRESGERLPVLVGAGGYFGPPNEKGEVEIGFSVMPARQGSGYATEMAAALIENAFNDIRVQKVIARTTPGNWASLKVIKKCGLHYAGRDDESGCDRYEILRSRQS